MSAKVYTFEELSVHNKEDDLWMAIDGKVYDCTKFLDEHPGGEEVMIDCGGIDATGPFDDVGHSDDAKDLLKDMYIGDLDTSSAPVATQVGSSATTGGEQNIGLFVAVGVILLAIVAYFALN